MVAAQKLKEAEITEQDSLLLTRNLLRIAIFNISYIRGLFPEKYFNDKSVPALEMKIKKLMPMDAESRRLIDWMEKGVYDALQKKYLKTLLFCVCEANCGPMIEEYTFSFSYSNSDSPEVSMNISRTGNKKGGTFKCNSSTDITPNQMRSSACKMVRTLVQLMRTLDKMPEERTILMKLLYYNDVTPADYEPPFFRGCTDQEAHNVWNRSPLKMEVGNVNSKHLVLSLKVKSVLDPCEDEHDDMQDNEVSLGADFEQRDVSSGSDSEVSQSQEDQYIITPVDNTQDPEEDEQQLSRVRDWITSQQRDTFKLTDILSNFPDISVALTEEIMEKLLLEEILRKSGADMFTINRPKVKNSEYEFTLVNEEAEDQLFPKGKKTPQVEDVIYMKALYHVLPMKFVTMSTLQNKLKGEANQTTVRKLIDKMAKDGFIEAKGNRRLGKRVIHSDTTEKKLIDVKKALNIEAMDVDVVESHNKVTFPGHQGMGNNHHNMSTCGVLHSIGSDLTRMNAKSEAYLGSTSSDQTIFHLKEQANTPMSKAKPAASRESFVQGTENNRTVGKHNEYNETDAANCSRSSQDQRCRKTSTVKEPILQYAKRQRSEAA